MCTKHIFDLNEQSGVCCGMFIDGVALHNVVSVLLLLHGQNRLYLTHPMINFAAYAVASDCVYIPLDGRPWTAPDLSAALDMNSIDNIQLRIDTLSAWVTPRYQVRMVFHNRLRYNMGMAVTQF